MTTMRFGPELSSEDWGRLEGYGRGSCKDCGGECSPECGLHPKGCFYGGFSKGYWMIAEDCELFHGEVTVIEV